jgi:hypothetical protein
MHNLEDTTTLYSPLEQIDIQIYTANSNTSANLSDTIVSYTLHTTHNI